LFDSSILNVDSVAFHINDKIILEKITFKVEEKDILCIVGPNGSGKSTLIKLLTQENRPTFGSIYFQNNLLENWCKNNIAKKRAVLSQLNNLSFPFKVLDIIKMGRYPFNNDFFNNSQIELSKEIIEIFDLNKFLDQNYLTLSGGEKQRVQLARVFMQLWSEKDHFDGKIVILDEPDSFLDIKHQQVLFKFLKRLNEKGLTIIMVLHDLNLSMMNSNKILMLKDARQVAFGDTREKMNKKNIFKCFGIETNKFKFENKEYITYRN